MNSLKDFEKLAEPFKAFIGNHELVYQLLDLNPTPIEVFAPDGMCLFMNRALLELNSIPDANFVVGQYNVYTDPMMIQLLGQENLDKVFRGETWSFSGFPAPIQEVADRGITDGKPFETATMDLFCLPIWDGDVFICTICFFTVKNMYQGRADIIAAQEYIKQNWLDDFDVDKIAQSVSLSKRHFQRIFKEVTGDTPMEYYRNIKIEKIQEKLLDDSLSIEQVFSVCGVGAHGTYSKLFKEVTKMSPSEYRKKMMK